MSSPADDLLRGCAAIASYIGVSNRRCIYLLERGELPAGKEGGGRWIASKTKLREHYEKLTGGEAA